MDITNLQLIAWIGFFCIGVASGIAAGVLVEKFRNKLPYVVAVVVVFFIAGVVLVALSYPTIVLVEIPDLTGLSKDQAELRLQEKGLIFTSTEQYHDTEEIRRVISQDLSPRLLVRKGTEVHFIVSKGPKPTPPPTPTPTITVKINSPKDGDSVPYGNKVSGTASTVPDDLYLWMVDQNLDNRIYYPNEGVSILKDEWDAKTWLGMGLPDESGKKFYIQAVLADEQADKEFRDYMDTREAKGYPGMSELPKGAKIHDQIMVTRE